jgi:integrase/recombinase XerD
MSPLRVALQDYLRVRRQLGFELKKDGWLLEDFVGFLEQAGATRISTELALAWAKLPEDAHPHRWRQRLGMVRRFARYLATIDPDSEVPPEDLLPAHQPRVAPYIYSQAEIASLMDASRALSPPLRAATYQTLIGLMAISGLRLGEALGLDRQDVDLERGALHVRAAKQNKQREVPLHHSTSEALGRYSVLRERHWPKADRQAFFISRPGLPLTAKAVHGTFPRLIRRVGLEGHGQRGRPRPHDLRHAFAVHTLLDWHREGVEVDRQMPLLSTYLGHAHPISTYWYLQAAPELLALVAQRLDGMLEGQS